MEVVTIKKRSFIISDGEIYNRIKAGGVEYLHFFFVDDTGGTSLIAKPPGDDELTLEKNYKKIQVHVDKILFRTPKQLSQHADKKAWCYTERLCPEKNELFRIKPVNFDLGKARTQLKDQFNPYFTTGNNLVLPHHYLNKHINHKITSLKLSFLRSTPTILSKGYLFAFVANRNFKGLRKKLYFLEKRNHNMRTKPVTKFMEYLKLHNKNINNYQYTCTLPLESCQYGMIVFKEVSNG